MEKLSLVNLYFAVVDNKITMTEFMAQVEKRESEAWQRGYDDGSEISKLVYAPVEVLKPEKIFA